MLSLFRHHGIDYHRITETIFLGTNACCQTHFAQELLSKGIRTDLSLEAEHLDQPEGVDHFLWLPTPDHTPPTVAATELGAGLLGFCEERNLPCYVHCKNGHGRGPTMVAAYLMRSRSLTAKEAIGAVRSKRPSIHLDPSQVAFLENWS